MTKDKPATSTAAEIDELIAKMGKTRSLPEAEQLARRAIQLKPDHPGFYLALGAVLHNRGKAAEAQAAYGECLKLDKKNVRALINLGSLQVDAGHPDAGMQALDAALYLAPDHLEARFHKSRALGMMGKTGEAFEILDDLAKKMPENVPVLKVLARCHQDMGNQTEAAEVLERAARLAPNDKAIASALAKLAN